MKWGIALNVRDSVSHTLEKAIIAEKGGLDQIWITDFPALRYAPTIAAAIAKKTSRCRIGVGLVSPLLYSTFQIVQFMNTLIESHGDRFDLLLGPGDRFALEGIGISHSPKTIVERTKTSLLEIKTGLLETGHGCSVFVGAQGPRMIEISLDADGVLLNYSDLEMARWAADKLRNKSRRGFQLGLFPPAQIGPCERIRDDPVISHSAAMVALGLGKSVAEHFGLSSALKHAKLQLKERGRIDSKVINSLGEEMLKKFAFCGTVEQLQDYVLELKSIGFTNVVFGPPIGLSREGIEKLALVKSTLF